MTTRICPTNANFPTSQGHNLASRADETLFTTSGSALTGLFTYNQTTGAGTFVASLSGEPLSGAINALAFDTASPTLYGVNNNKGGISLTHLVTIHTTSGAITDIGSSVNDLDAIAFQPPPPVVETPEPSTNVDVLGIGLVALGYAAKHRFSA